MSQIRRIKDKGPKTFFLPLYFHSEIYLAIYFITSGSLMMYSATELNHFAVLENRDSVVHPLLDHPVHQLPISGEGVELQNLISPIPQVIIPTALNMYYLEQLNLSKLINS